MSSLVIDETGAREMTEQEIERAGKAMLEKMTARKESDAHERLIESIRQHKKAVYGEGHTAKLNPYDAELYRAARI